MRRATVPLSDLRLGEVVRSERVFLDHVARLIEVGPEAWPPIAVQAGTMKVLDGAHRRAAATRLGLTHIEAEIHDVTDGEALAFAIRSNIAHGLPLTLDERKSVARRLIEATDWSDSRIAAECGLNNKTVAAARPKRPTGQIPKLDTPVSTLVGTPPPGAPSGAPGESAAPSKRVGVDGKGRPATADAAAAARRAAAEIATNEPDASARDIAERSGVSKSTAATVKKDPARHLGVVPDLPETADDEPPSVGDLVVLAPVHWAADDRCQRTDAGREFGRFMDRFTRWHDKAFAAWLDQMLAQCPADLRVEAADVAKSMAAGWTRFANEVTTNRMEAAQ